MSSYAKDRLEVLAPKLLVQQEKKNMVMAATLSLVFSYLCWCQGTDMWEYKSFKLLGVNSESVKGPDLTGFLPLVAVDAISKAEVSVSDDIPAWPTCPHTRKGKDPQISLCMSPALSRLHSSRRTYLVLMV